MVAEIRVDPRGKRRAQARLPWIFRDQVEEGESESGTIVRVIDGDARQLGYATYSAESKITLRFLSFGEHAAEPMIEEIASRFFRSVERRADLATVSDGMRLVSSEADGLPGIIVDRYREVVVIQTSTAFADELLPELAEWSMRLPGVEAVFVRNDASVRRLENLALESKWIAGSPRDQTEIREGTIRFGIDLAAGQKTGFFLDQRRNRIGLERHVKPGARVLDAFAYSGAFALHAAKTAGEVLALDDSKNAVSLIEANAQRNGMSNVTAERANAFDRLRAFVKDGTRFDVVVLDPPAFAKNKAEREDALRGYREINVRAMRLLTPGGILVSASCSYQVDESSFEDMLRDAAGDAGRSFIILERGQQDVDHPILLQLPESRYLKCFFLRAD